MSGGLVINVSLGVVAVVVLYCPILALVDRLSLIYSFWKDDDFGI